MGLGAARDVDHPLRDYYSGDNLWRMLCGDQEEEEEPQRGQKCRRGEIEDEEEEIELEEGRLGDGLGHGDEDMMPFNDDGGGGGGHDNSMQDDVCSAIELFPSG